MLIGSERIMKPYNTETPENTYTLSEGDIAVIHALCFYSPDGMTQKADKVREKLEEQFRMHEAIGKIKVWVD